MVLSPQALLAASHYYKSTPDQFMHRLKATLAKRFPTLRKIYSLQKAIKICHELVFEEYKTKSKQQETILCSECPGWVCYAEKTLTSAITELMSEVKSPQQVLGGLIRKELGNECLIVSVMPCYDKKREAIRFEYEENVKEVDLTIATTELIDLVAQTNPEFASM